MYAKDDIDTDNDNEDMVDEEDEKKIPPIVEETMDVDKPDTQDDESEDLDEEDGYEELADSTGEYFDHKNLLFIVR